MNILDKQGVTYLCNYMYTSEHVIIHARVCVCVCVCVCVFPFCSRPSSVSSRLHLGPAVLVASCALRQWFENPTCGRAV